MPILYLMNATPFLEESVLQAALSLVESRRRERIMQMKDNKNRALSLAAGVLLSYAVNRWEKEKTRCQMSVDFGQVIAFLAEAQEHATIKIPETETYENGKPYLKNMQGIFFNLSHSGDYVVCVLADGEIGVDIQQYRKNIKDGVLKRVFHMKEKAVFETYTPEEREAYFYRIWAAKEAYAKYTGEGLAVDFRLLLTNFERQEITDTRTDRIYSLQVSEELKGYAIAVVQTVK